MSYVVGARARMKKNLGLVLRPSPTILPTASSQTLPPPGSTPPPPDDSSSIPMTSSDRITAPIVPIQDVVSQIQVPTIQDLIKPTNNITPSVPYFEAPEEVYQGPSYNEPVFHTIPKEEPPPGSIEDLVSTDDIFQSEQSNPGYSQVEEPIMDEIPPEPDYDFGYGPPGGLEPAQPPPEDPIIGYEPWIDNDPWPDGLTGGTIYPGDPNYNPPWESPPLAVPPAVDEAETDLIEEGDSKINQDLIADIEQKTISPVLDIEPQHPTATPEEAGVVVEETKGKIPWKLVLGVLAVGAFFSFKK